MEDIAAPAVFDNIIIGQIKLVVLGLYKGKVLEQFWLVFACVRTAKF